VHRRTLLKAALVTPALAAPLATAAPAGAVTLRVGRTLSAGLTFPWGIDFLPDGSALVTERNSGRVLRVRPGGGHTVVGTVPGVHNNGGEGGLMGLALSPTFDSDRQVYLFLTTSTDNRVIRVGYEGGRLGERHVVLAGIPRNQTHNGGGLWVQRGSRPSLFVTTGDTRRPGLAQDKTSLAGKILRLKPDGSAQDGNPYGTRVFTHGHRNPEGITIAPDGRIWSSELGENTWDELNRIRAGQNYGWSRVEGRDGRGGYHDPFVQWHTADCSPSAVAVADGQAYVAALRGEALWQVDLRGSGIRRTVRHFHGRFGRIRMVKRAPDGSLWIGTSNGGGNDTIVRINRS
jgi:glucose/arabinose dehydrogenase